MIYLVVFSAVTFALLIGALVFIALKFSEAFKDALSLASALHSRSLETLDQTLDRFMAVDFSEYKLAEQAVELEGFQELPETEDEGTREVIQDLPWGMTEHEQKKKEEEDRILREDFVESQ